LRTSVLPFIVIVFVPKTPPTRSTFPGQRKSAGDQIQQDLITGRIPYSIPFNDKQNNKTGLYWQQAFFKKLSPEKSKFFNAVVAS